jgi:uncharacterized protein
MNAPDWTLCAIHFAGSRGLSPVQLQKALFVLGQEMKREVGARFYQFIPYNYGPFCKAVYEDAAQLAEQGLISINEVPGQRWHRFVITPTGAEHAQVVMARAQVAAVDYLHAVVDWVSPLPFATLVRAIYQRYPRYRANSVFNG